jgi:CheY-like chemotaxis protein
VLLAEDQPELRELVRETLEASGYRVLEAPDGSQALALAAAHDGPIHLLLTDVVMPALGGPQLAKALESMRPETKVLFFSGYTDDALGRYGIVDAAVALLTKPFDANQLLTAVRAALDGEPPPGGARPG